VRLAPVSSAPPGTTLARWTNAAKCARGMTGGSSLTPAYIMNTEKIHAELVPVLQGLDQLQCLASASTPFRDVVIREMKSIIRQHLPTSTEDKESIASASTQECHRNFTQPDKSSILSLNFRALRPGEAEAFFVNVYCKLGEALRRLSIQAKILLDIISNMDQTSNNVLAPMQSAGKSGNSAVCSPDILTGHEVQTNFSPNVETPTKETLTLRRVLDKYLPESRVRMIVGTVFVVYNELWSKAFEHAVVWTEAGQAR